jgi:leucyl-tRNA synthetase
VHLNTAISAMMELVNGLYAFCDRDDRALLGRRAEEAALRGQAERRETIAVLKEAVEALLRMLSPFAPHMAEELWERLGHVESIEAAGWPEFDPEVAKAEEIVVPVQVNGKVRGRITVPADIAEAELRERALADPQVQSHVSGRQVKKVVVAGGGKLVSVVVA